MLLVMIIENNRIDAYFMQVRLSKSLEPLAGARNKRTDP